MSIMPLSSGNSAARRSGTWQTRPSATFMHGVPGSAYSKSSPKLLSWKNASDRARRFGKHSATNANRTCSPSARCFTRERKNCVPVTAAVPWMMARSNSSARPGAVTELALSGVATASFGSFLGEPDFIARARASSSTLAPSLDKLGNFNKARPVTLFGSNFRVEQRRTGLCNFLVLGRAFRTTHAYSADHLAIMNNRHASPQWREIGQCGHRKATFVDCVFKILRWLLGDC